MKGWARPHSPSPPQTPGLGARWLAGTPPATGGPRPHHSQEGRC